MIPLILILLLLSGCGSEVKGTQWIYFPAGVEATFKGMTNENPKAKQIWENAEACAGHAQKEPVLIIVDGMFYCGNIYPSEGCCSLEKGIMVITDGVPGVDTDIAYYHESMHILLNSSNENLVKAMAISCKAKYNQGKI